MSYGFMVDIKAHVYCNALSMHETVCKMKHKLSIRLKPFVSNRLFH